MAESEKTTHKILKYIATLVLVVIFFETLFFFFAKPILKSSLVNWVYEKSDSLYTIDFDKLKVNMLTGNILLTNFILEPDTATYFSKNHEISKNLYELKLDTFKIKHIRLFPLLKKENELSVKLLRLSNPVVKVFAKSQKGTTEINQNSVSYETVKKDLFESIFKYTNAFIVDKIVITNGNFDFLKPRSDNANQFSIDKVTLILNNFYADINTFSTDKKSFFSENIEIIIADYELKLNDNIHILAAKRVYINTGNKKIELTDIKLYPQNQNKVELSTLDQNIFDISVDDVVFNNADFKEIYEKGQLHLSKALMEGLDINIFKQKISEKKKFNKDTLLNKIDIFPLFSNYLSFVQIDTIAVLGGSFKNFPNILSNHPKTSISNFDIKIYDFLIDSKSVSDTNRILYAHNLTMTLEDFKSEMNDSIHTLNAEHIEASTLENGIKAKNITITPNNEMFQWARFHHKSFNNITINSMNILGFDFVKFSNNNELVVDKFDLGETQFEIRNYPDIHKKTQTQPLDQLFQSFADRIIINQINIPTGRLTYFSTKQDQTTSISGNFRMIFRKFTFDPFRKKLTKLASVQSVDLLFTKFNFDTPDKLYHFTIDTVKYSTYSSKLTFANLKLAPIQNKIHQKLEEINKSTIISVQIPKIIVSNTNLSNAFQADSLSLTKVVLNNPTFEVTSFPNVAKKDTKRRVTNFIKKKSIANIVNTSAEIEILAYLGTPETDSLTLKIFNQKKTSIDTLTKLSVHIISLLKINPNEIRADDSSISVISTIEKITINKLNLLANSNLTLFQIDTLTSSALSQISYLEQDYNSPKFNQEEVLTAIGLFLPKIISDSLFINNGLIILNSKTRTGNKIILKTNFNLQLCKFNFNKDSILINRKILFSEAFKLEIKNSIFNLKDSIHQIKIASIEFSSPDSSIKADNIIIVPKYQDSLKTTFLVKIPQIKSSGVDFEKLYIDHILDIKTIKLSEPEISLNLSNKKKDKTQKKQSLSYIFLPDFTKKLKIDQIKIEDGEISVKQNIFSSNFEILSSKFNINLYDFLIDSVTNIAQNTFFIPIQNFSIELSDFKYRTKDTLQKIAAEQISINTKNKLISISKPEYKTTITKKEDIIEKAKKKNITNFWSEEILLHGLDYEKLRFSNQLTFNSLSIEKPVIELFSPYKKPREPKKQFKLEDIDLFKTTSKFFKSINGNNITIHNIDFTNTTCSDSITKSTHFDKISIQVDGLKIDSTTTSTTPNLLYCENLNVILKDYIFLTKNKLYKAHFGEIRLSTQMKKIDVSNFYFKPAVSNVQDSFKYKTVILDVEGQKLTITGIELKELLNKNINARTITGDSITLKTYVDKNYPHNPSIKKHMISAVLDAPVGINISSVILSNINIYYEEINPDNQQKAYIYLNDCDLKVFRITNDTARINAKDTYTIVKAHGFINDSAELDISLFFELKSNGENVKIKGEIGECNANVFNTYTVNGVNLDLSEGVFHRIAFDFKVKDTLAIGKMKMEYNDLKAYLISKDTLKRNKLKFISWIADAVLVKNDNPKYGIYPKLGKIAYIHDKKYSDLSMWVKALLSGVQSTIAFDPKDAKKIRKIMRKNKKEVEDL